MSTFVLITGASSGIGFELAKLFAKDHHNLILVGRKLETLEAAALELHDTFGIDVRCMPKDLSNPLAAYDIVQELEKENIFIEILVNNAGFGGYGLFWEDDLTNDQSMIQVNISSLVALTRLLLPQMVKNGSGKVLNVASVAAFLPGPMMAVYFATKAFVLSFGIALAAELEGTGVTVTTLCPGPTKTSFDKRANASHLPLFSDANTMSAEKVAQIGYRSLFRRKTYVVTGFTNKLSVFFTKFVPKILLAKIVKKAQS